MKINASMLNFFLFLIFATASYGFEWPGSGKKQQPPAASQASNSIAEAAVESPEMVRSPQDSKTKNLTPVETKLPRSGVPSVDLVKAQTAAAVTDTPDPINTQALEVQQKIEELLKLNESLKQSYQNQAAEIARINEQARIHQKILQSIQIPKLPVIPQVHTDVLIAQEKLRIIEQTTRQGRSYVDALKAQKAVQTIETIQTVEEALKKQEEEEKKAEEKRKAEEQKKKQSKVQP